MKKVLITGATGFIGSRLCEVLWLTGGFKPVAFIHSTASAARIARFPMDFALGDLCDRNSVSKAAEGCDAVVHLARGDRQVMRRGLENILRAAIEGRMERFVHLSSVAVYGNHPSQDSVSEIPPPNAVDNPYGNEKLRQEHLVWRYHREKRLPAVILRPPNIYGPFSHFTIDVIRRLRAGNLPLVDDGQNPCNLVYIDNLIEAILFALWKPEAVGEAFFIVDSEVVSWAQYFEDNTRLVGVSLPRISTEELRKHPKERVIIDSLYRTPRVLLSGELRKVLRQIPLVRSVDDFIYARFQSLSAKKREALRRVVNGPEIISRNGKKSFDETDNLIAAQQRPVAHSGAKAKQLLGYTAPVTHAEGMALTEDWLRFCKII